MSNELITAEQVDGGFDLHHPEWGPFPFNPVPQEFVDTLAEGQPYDNPEDEAFATAVVNAVEEARNG